MKIKVQKSSRAINDFAKILNNLLDQDAVDAGLRFADAFDNTLERIADFPDLGSRWESSNPRHDNVRYWPIRGFEQYLVFYRRSNEVVVVTHVLHTRQDIEAIL